MLGEQMDRNVPIVNWWKSGRLVAGVDVCGRVIKG